MDYNAIHANRAAELLPLEGKTVLVVGANTGGDCRYFVEFGCQEVHGLDVIDEIGRDFQHPKVTYHQMSVEQLDLPSDCFDLVYCFATMEHVPRIESAFLEMARVTKPGGFIYSVAAPLWNSRVGHHKADLFSNYPWIHLRLTRDEIIEYCTNHGISAPGGAPSHVDYMLDRKYFNMLPAARYVDACAQLPAMRMVRNDLELEAADEHLAKALSELAPKGYTETELRAVAHVYIAQKIRPSAESAVSPSKSMAPTALVAYVAELREHGINLLDIGSSGSLDARWNAIKDLVNLVGFDPNKEECERQNKLATPFKRAKFLPYAIHGKDGTETLHRTRSIYCYSLLKPNKPWLDRFSFHDLFDVQGEERIAVRAIDSIAELDGFFPDIIKIDVQGLELPILSKAGRLLDSAFYVETETGFTENYVGETTFSQLDGFMQANGFLMFDINVNHRISRDNRFKDTPTGKEQILWAEAVWLKDYIGLERQGRFDVRSFTEQKVKKVLILCALQGCIDFGYELACFFHERGLLSRDDVDALETVAAWDLHVTVAAEPAAPPPASASRTLLARLLGILPQRWKQAIHRATGPSL